MLGMITADMIIISTILIVIAIIMYVFVYVSYALFRPLGEAQ